MFICQVVNGKDNFGWGAVVNFQKKANQSKVCIGKLFLVFFHQETLIDDLWFVSIERYITFGFV